MSAINYQTARFEGSFNKLDDLPESNTPEVAVIGRSNVGKSSLLNRLFDRHDLVKVSSTPGRTTAINFFAVDGIRFVDLPGFGFAKVPRQQAEQMTRLIEGYLESLRSTNLVLALMDIRRDSREEEKDMLATLEQEGLEFTIVLTKADKLSKHAAMIRADTLARAYNVDPRSMCVTSAKTGLGVDDLKKRIEVACLEV